MSHRLLFSASEAFLDEAVAALDEAFPAAAVRRLGPDLGEVQGPSPAEVAAAARRGDTIFVRHLAEVVDEVAIADVVTRTLAVGVEDASLQVWASGAGAPKAEQIRSEVVDAAGPLPRGGRRTVVGVCLTPSAAFVCRTAATEALADWPGGRVRLARPPDLVSRAELKLDELLKLAPELLDGATTAVDLGASPGGWTKVLRRHGLPVVAVDPGDLHPAVAADPGVDHVRTTAGRYFAELDPAVTFDVLVNDMRMDPALSTKVVVGAAPRVRRGGVVVLTLKLSARRAMATVKPALRALEPAFEVTFARQLFHNKDEVTIAGRRR